MRLGLRIDVSLAASAGGFPELVTSNWTNLSTGTGSATVSGRQLTIVRVDAANKGALVQSPAYVAGRQYLMTGTVSGGPAFIGLAGVGANFGVGAISYPFTAASAAQMTVEAVNDATTVVIDNLSIKQTG